MKCRVVNIIASAISLIWVVCLIICVLKAKYGMAIVGIVAGVAQEIGLPPIGGYARFTLGFQQMKQSGHDLTTPRVRARATRGSGSAPSR